MPEITEKKYEYDVYNITKSELDRIEKVAFTTGRPIDSVAQDLAKSKYTNISDTDARILGTVSETAWANNNNVSSYSVAERTAEYRKEHNLDATDVQNCENDWRSVLREYKNGTYQFPIAPENAIEEEKLIPENNTIHFSESADPNNPNVVLTSDGKTEIISPPSPTWRMSALTYASDASVAPSMYSLRGASALSQVSAEVMTSAKHAGLSAQKTELIDSAISAVGDSAEKYNNWTDKKMEIALEYISDWLSPKLNDAEATTKLPPKALKETRDKVTNKLADQLLTAYDASKKVFGEAVKFAKSLFEKQPDTTKSVGEVVKDTVTSAIDGIKNIFADNAVLGVKVSVDNANIGLNNETMTKLKAFWKKVTDSIDKDELKQVLDNCAAAIDKELIDAVKQNLANLKEAFNKAIKNPVGKVVNDFMSKIRNRLNKKRSTQPDINNAIMDALSKYLPEKYRYVEHLQSIPTDVMKAACDQLEYELKTDSKHSLSTSDRERIMNIMWLSSGLGGYHNQLQTFMTSLNRFGGTNVTPATEHVGLTFITRPRLCLQSSNIRNNRILTTLDTLNNSTMAFAIRCLLDSNFGNANDGLYSKYVSSSPIFDQQNPFLVPLCNALIGFNGSPDFDIESTTTDGGYMSEAQTFAIGGSNLQRGNYQLNLNFQEVAHNPILAILYYWIEYIRCVTRGSLMAYADDIDAQRLNYTVSIYRFLLDPSHRYITKYAKYTGCYPIGIPIGAAFNFSQGDVEVTASKNLSITFNCNKVEYMDYAILMDFNTLMRRYCPIINKGTKLVTGTRTIEHITRVPYWKEKRTTNPETGEVHIEYTREYEERVSYETEQYVEEHDVEYVPTDDEGRINDGYSLKCPSLPIEALANFRGLPYIVSDRNGFRLDFRQHPSPAFNYQTETLSDQLLYLDMIGRLSKEMANYDTVTNLYTPDYYSKAEAYKNVDLREFIRKAFENAGSADTHSPIK